MGTDRAIDTIKNLGISVAGMALLTAFVSISFAAILGYSSFLKLFFPVGVDMSILEWSDEGDVRLDDLMVFGKGYDFFGLESLSQYASGPNGNYRIWPNNKKWSLYRDSDGAFSFERFETEEMVKKAAERWCKDELRS